MKLIKLSITLTIYLLLLPLLVIPRIYGQERQSKYIAGGISVSQEIPSSISGWGALAIPLRDGSYSFTAIDAYSLNQEKAESQYSFLGKKFQVSARTGIAYKFFTFKKLSLFGLGDFGITKIGDSISSSVAGGGFLHFKFHRLVGAIAILEADRSAITGTDFKPRFGLTLDLGGLSK